MSQVAFKPVGEYLFLSVPGVAEGLPNVLSGDSVIASDVTAPHDSPEYQGFIHEVQREGILLRFNDQFHSNYNNQDYNVQFVLSRQDRAFRFCLKYVKINHKPNDLFVCL